jgi:MoaA/NifB/PqqE/SkfB family radical SAM enzyme
MKQYDFANILFAGPCNLRCPYCIGRQIDPALNRDNLHEFPLRDLDAFTELLRWHGVRQVVLTGTTTDPQLYRHEARLIDWLRERLPGVRLSLHTNGQLALQKMDTFNLYDRVSLSLPSFDPDVHEKMTGSRRVPDLAAILQAARVPVKVSCVVNEHNAGRLEAFLGHCCDLGIRRVVLRQLYGDPRWWPLPWRLRRLGTYRRNPVYDYRGMEVTYWRFDATASTSINLFSDGTISDEYLLAKARSCSTQSGVQDTRLGLTSFERRQPVCIG